MSKSFDIIVACDLNRGIGRDGHLPWKLSADLRYFKELTSAASSAGCNNAVIMGRRTWESIPPARRPLPHRLNVVVSHQPDFELPEPAIAAASLDEALGLHERLAVDRYFVIGGALLYKAAIEHPLCNRLYLTEIKSVFDCDTFFPDYSGAFDLIASSEIQQEDGMEFCFKTFRKSLQDAHAKRTSP